MLEFAVAEALGGDGACDVAVLRAQPGVFGPVASDPTVSRLITRFAHQLADLELRHCPHDREG